MVSCFFIAARFELADEFPNTQPRSGAGVREEPPEEVPIKSGKSESPRPKEAGYRLVSCFFIAARFELADEFPNTQPRSGAGVREEPPEEVPIKSGKSESPRPKEAGYRLVSCFFIAARFELADEFPNTQPRSGAGVREEPPEEVPIKSGNQGHLDHLEQVLKPALFFVRSIFILNYLCEITLCDGLL